MEIARIPEAKPASLHVFGISDSKISISAIFQKYDMMKDKLHNSRATFEVSYGENAILERAASCELSILRSSEIMGSSSGDGIREIIHIEVSRCLVKLSGVGL